MMPEIEPHTSRTLEPRRSFHASSLSSTQRLSTEFNFGHHEIALSSGGVKEVIVELETLIPNPQSFCDLDKMTRSYEVIVFAKKKSRVKFT